VCPVGGGGVGGGDVPPPPMGSLLQNKLEEGCNAVVVAWMLSVG